jgi:hypothetical protein
MRSRFCSRLVREWQSRGRVSGSILRLVDIIRHLSLVGLSYWMGSSGFALKPMQNQIYL